MPPRTRASTRTTRTSTRTTRSVSQSLKIPAPILTKLQMGGINKSELLSVLRATHPRRFQRLFPDIEFHNHRPSVVYTHSNTLRFVGFPHEVRRERNVTQIVIKRRTAKPQPPSAVVNLGWRLLDVLLYLYKKENPRHPVDGAFIFETGQAQRPRYVHRKTRGCLITDTIELNIRAVASMEPILRQIFRWNDDQLKQFFDLNGQILYQDGEWRIWTMDAAFDENANVPGAN